ncbi:alpha/beta-hydrolase [Artomyces pyxidatus]|uniref:Alpha/beta-hydrolase n=1 Tax=Artomyces pyxidatus TaxID=48021 RepID=A0ACB8SY11_9AGAM|nr:alpha/beta-hydrolase [Artomyces pyxidatus]
MDFPASDVKHTKDALYIPLGPSTTRKILVLAHHRAVIFLVAIILAAAFSRAKGQTSGQLKPFYAHVTRPEGLCTGVNGRTFSSIAGHIGLKGDTEAHPKRSFFWFFEAEHDSDNAPIILSVGGGPGSSGMVNPMLGQSPCAIAENRTVANPNRWTEKFNLLALDHPIGVGFSYGTHVNTSRAGAYDVYDFLQKFFRLYPQLSKNKFAVTSGSFGGAYVPNIAAVIHEQNILLAQGKGQPGAVHIDLESVILSNPLSDPITHFQWLLQYRCVETSVYNATTCAEMYAVLPACLETLQLAHDYPSTENNKKAFDLCFETMEGADTHGTLIEDVRRKSRLSEHCRKCEMTDGIATCFPEIQWISNYFNSPATKAALGISHLNFTSMSAVVNQGFVDSGDIIQRHHLLYEPLLKDGIRLLQYSGMYDASCAWPGVLSSLKLLRTPLQQDFNHAPEVPWPARENATVRVVGEGAGQMTHVKVANAGHLTVKDQPALVKMMVDHWMENRPFVSGVKST